MCISLGFHKIGRHRAPVWQIQLQTENISCNNQPDSNAARVCAPNHFSLMLYNVINYNDVTSATCPYKYTKSTFY